MPTSGRRITVGRLIGEGSQGAVFEATCDSPAPLIALKWYFAHTATDAQRRAISVLIERGAPSERFLWPTELVHAPGQPGFGYAMPLRPPRFAALADLLTGKADMPFVEVCRLCL